MQKTIRYKDMKEWKGLKVIKFFEFAVFYGNMNTYQEISCNNNF